MDDWAESDLAWELADLIGPLLADSDRAQLYAAIGSGNSHTAIRAVLHRSARTNLALPAALVDRLAEWLDPYAHSIDAVHLHRLLDAVRSRD